MVSVASDIVERMAAFVESNPRSRAAKAGIVRNHEFERINALPRRTWDAVALEALADQLTAILALPPRSCERSCVCRGAGFMRLNAIQAQALYELAACRGLLGPIKVGGGKTLVSFLAPTVLGVQRSLLLLPASHLPKAQHELILYARHWRVATTMHFESYTRISRHDGDRILERAKPQLIVADEAHKIRNTRAGCTKKVRRYVERRGCHCVVLSGTLIRKRLTDWSHLAAMALKDKSPAPHKWQTAASWGGALDIDGRGNGGALRAWCAEGETVREGYRRRVVESPGVVATSEALLGVGLEIKPWDGPSLDPWFVDALERLEHDWTLPDGVVLVDPLAYYRAARQLSLGVYYRYRVPPPDHWTNARKQWSTFVRHAVRYHRRREGLPFDTEYQVVLACDGGDLPREDLDHWREVKPTFVPDIEHVWVTTDIVDAVIRSARLEPSIVWVESTAVGHMMHARGLPYYGRGASTPEGEHIITASPPASIAASIHACREGLNLQAWARNIITCPTGDAGIWEQSLARTHREGQDADTVTAEVLLTSRAHRRAWCRAIEHASFLQESTGQAQKLLQASIFGMPEDE